MLKEEIGWLGNVERAKKPARLPVVLTRDEVDKLFSHLQGTPRLMAGLLYGSGLRRMECVRLRVKDVDFGYAKITVRDGNGAKDRVTMLPINLTAALQRHICRMSWPENIQTRSGNGAGNGFFLRHGSRSIRVRKRTQPDASDAITSKRVGCSWR